MGNAVAIALTAVMVMLVSSALLEGPALGDFWTLYLSDTALSVDKLADKRWILDIRPPVFDAWATLLSYVGLDTITLGRLLSNIPALFVLVLGTRLFSRRLPDQGSFYTIFLLLTLSAPAVIDSFGTFRGDFWQLVAFTIQILLARHIMFVQQDYRPRTDRGIALLAILATLASITLDYGGAMFGGILAMATILVALARGLRRWARSLIIIMVIAVAAILKAIIWQASAWDESFDLYQNWIEMGPTSTAAILFGLLFGTVLHNPLAAGGAYIGRDRWDKGDTAFVVMIGAALIASLFAVIQVDAQRRLVTSSNSIDIAVLVSALLATAATKVADRKLWMNGLAIVAVISSLVSLTRIGLGGAWQTGAKQVARMVDQCPGTQVYAASGWRLDVATGSKAAAREEPVFTLGYKRLGKTRNFNPIIAHPSTPITVTPGKCPTIVWIEEVPGRRNPKAAEILKAVGLKGLDGARTTIIRTSSGLILRAQR